YLICMLNRHEGEDLTKCLFALAKNRDILKSEHFGHSSAHPVQHVVEIGMNRKNGNVVLDSLNHRSLHVILSVDLLQPAKNDGMMRHHEITFFGDSFIHDLLYCVERADYSFALPTGIAGDQSRVVITLLQRPRSDRFQVTDNLINLHGTL